MSVPGTNDTSPPANMPGTDEVAGQQHHVLAVLAGQQLANTGLGPGLPFSVAVSVRMQRSKHVFVSPRVLAEVRVAHGAGSRMLSMSSIAVGPLPHSTPPVLSDTRRSPASPSPDASRR